MPISLSLIVHKNACFPIALPKLAVIDLLISSNLKGEECLSLHQLITSRPAVTPLHNLLSCCALFLPFFYILK